MTIAAISTLGAPNILTGLLNTPPLNSQPSPSGPDFASMVDGALKSVSTAQMDAQTAEQGYSVGAPGATLGKAVVASDRAEIAWNATVAVRNEVVSAYSSIMNMQF